MTTPPDVGDLVAAFRRRSLSPVEVTEAHLARIDTHDRDLHAFLSVTRALARRQAAEAEAAHRRGDDAPLLGVAVSIKDLFPVAREVTTFGSLIHRDAVSPRDSGVVRRLRAAGAVFTGKTNTAEFGQSATTENRLGPPCANPWDATRTSGGSSGGAAASVAAGLSAVAVGTDGGGSVRIPAAFTGLVGFKPTFGLCPDEGGLRAMTPFSTPGPLTRRVRDARILLGVLAATAFPRRSTGPLRIGWCPQPEGRPVDRRLLSVVAAAVGRLGEIGHTVDEVILDVAGWQDIFGPLVTEEEFRERGHLLDVAELLTDYERVTIEAGSAQSPAVVAAARAAHRRYRARASTSFEGVDVVVTPSTAVPAFAIETRPTAIADQAVGSLWGAFPFTAAWNVAGFPAVSLPCGLVDDLPVGLQLVAPHGGDGLLLDLAEDVEALLDFDHGPVLRRWAVT